MKHRTVDLWVADGGPEFKSKNTEDFCREMHIRRKFIAPWSPWQNMGETAWRIILRPIRVSLASANAGKRLWPFAASQAALVYNMLSPYVPYDGHDNDRSNSSFLSSISFQALAQSLSDRRLYSSLLAEKGVLTACEFCSVKLKFASATMTTCVVLAGSNVKSQP